jgi:hypothetical protein
VDPAESWLAGGVRNTYLSTKQTVSVLEPCERTTGPLPVTGNGEPATQDERLITHRGSYRKFRYLSHLACNLCVSLPSPSMIASNDDTDSIENFCETNVVQFRLVTTRLLLDFGVNTSS